MKTVVIRHAEVDFDWSRECSSKEFDSDCSRYDSAPIKDITYKIPEIGYERVYISELSRSRNTAEKLFPDGFYTETGLINEVPLRSGYDTDREMPLWFWNITGRIQWLVNSSRQVEGRKKTHTLLGEMKKAGFRMNIVSGRYKNGEYVIAEK